MEKYIAQALAPQQEIIAMVLRLKEPLRQADDQGSPFTILELRNAVAHGEDVHRFPKLSRLTVDAVKRTLILEEAPPLLAQITKLRLQQSPVNSGRA